jgi:hypothetical protein
MDAMTQPKYLVPTALFGTGVLAAAGYFLKTQLLELMRSLSSTVSDGLTMTRHLGSAFRLDTMLARAGLERRRRVSKVVLPAAGFAAGLVGGSALTLLFARRMRESAEGQRAPFAAANDERPNSISEPSSAASHSQ